MCKVDNLTEEELSRAEKILKENDMRAYKILVRQKDGYLVTPFLGASVSTFTCKCWGYPGIMSYVDINQVLQIYPQILQWWNRSFRHIGKIVLYKIILLELTDLCISNSSELARRLRTITAVSNAYYLQEEISTYKLLKHIQCSE